MQGRRLADGEQEGIPANGTYWRDGRGVWLCMTPNGLHGDLSRHTVTEHEDGTITVGPSILVTGSWSWHGYLERGVWREV